MSLLPYLSHLLRNLFRKQRTDDDLNAEVRAYVEALTREKIAAGMPPGQARRAALIELGGTEQVKERVREERAGSLLDQLAQDVRYGLRTLRKNPGFTVVAVLTLALGIGANAAIFGLLNSLNYRTLPVHNPEDLAEIRIVVRKPRSGNFNGRRPELTSPQWELVRQRQEAFSGVMAWHSTSFNLSARGEDRFAENSLFVSGEFFNVLGVRPALGRLFTVADDQLGCAAPGAVISYPFWQREFGGARSALGSKLAINGHPFEVIGVTPANFFGVEVGRQFDLAIPICADAILNPEGIAATAGGWLQSAGSSRAGRASALLRSSAQFPRQSTKRPCRRATRLTSWRITKRCAWAPSRRPPAYPVYGRLTPRRCGCCWAPPGWCC